MNYEFHKVAFLANALEYVKQLPELGLFKYQRLSGVTGYDRTLYLEFNNFLDILAMQDINKQTFVTDMVKELLDKDVMDPVVYTLIAKRYSDILQILPENMKKIVEFQMTAETEEEFIRISKHINTKKHMMYCLHVALDAQVLRSLRKKGVSVINSQYLQLCAVDEKRAIDKELLTLVNSYSKKAISLTREWNHYKQSKEQIIDPRVIEYWATRDKTNIDVKELKELYNKYLLSIIGL